jgi:L-2-hydroxycarboxylate dehydrogenase (NAD+)
VKWLRDGAMKAEPNIRVVTENASTALLDADNGMGFVAGHRAMELAIKKAKESGVGIVTSNVTAATTVCQRTIPCWHCRMT